MVQAKLRRYRGFLLDDFQAEAIDKVEQGESVLVCAPTGTGKTLVADFLIEKCFQENRQVIYTAPIKALSNQKFKEFKRLMGPEHVGILTGDIVMNPDAPVLLMTTEIFRNLVHLSPERLQTVAWVIFDEIHYIDDPDRGSVWEESLIFLPEHMRFLGLSATIPNASELAAWVASLHGRPVPVVTHTERAVPLAHALFEESLGFCNVKQLKRRYDRLAQASDFVDGRGRRPRFQPTTHLELLKAMGTQYLPCLFFTFSRRKCELNATELAAVHDYLGQDGKDQVLEVIDETLRRHQVKRTARLKHLQGLLLKGIGYHHAGLLPLMKDIVEECFERRLTSVLYCTETFAVGLNFPCKAVCFDSVTKWDGTEFRAISNREYFQMAGRAGRRGIDERGYVFTVCDLNWFDPNQFPTMKETDIEPLRSQFSLSYNTVLNLIRSYSQEEIRDILLNNFAAYQADAARSRLTRRMESLQQEADRLAGCHLMDTDNCPVLYDRLLRKVAEADRHQAAQKKGGRRVPKSIRRHYDQLRTQLETARRQACEPYVIVGCEAALPAYRKAVTQIGKLRRELREISPAQRFLDEFDRKRSLLEELEYLRGDKLTSRGMLAAQIHVQELLVTELICSGILHGLDPNELNGVVVSIDYEPRKSEVRLSHDLVDTHEIYRMARSLQQLEEERVGKVTTRFHDHLLPFTYHWSRGAGFGELLRTATVDEGDLVYAFRRCIDLLRQIRSVSRDDAAFAAKVEEAISRMDRDEVSIVL